MRPRPSGRGCVDLKVEVHHAVNVASMRPRPSGRGCGVDMPACDVEFLASMRPRPSGRGCARSRSTRWSSPACFNEAAAVRPRMRAERHRGDRHCTHASMRPRPSGRGCHADSVDPDQLERASMRPRPSGRGCARARKARELHLEASMRPRPSGRGCPYPYGSSRGAATALQ